MEHCWFATFTYCDMITTVGLAITYFMSYNYHFSVENNEDLDSQQLGSL